MRIFISYRRDDTSDIAQTICERLVEPFGAENIFFDVDAIPAGIDFREHIETQVERCDVLLAVIGDRWLSAADKRGDRRLNNATDFVRIEIEAALRRNIPVVPVLVERATIPPEVELPQALRPIVYHQAIEIRAGKDRSEHLRRLVKALNQIEFGMQRPAQPPRQSAGWNHLLTRFLLLKVLGENRMIDAVFFLISCITGLFTWMLFKVNEILPDGGDIAAGLVVYLIFMFVQYGNRRRIIEALERHDAAMSKVAGR